MALFGIGKKEEGKKAKTEKKAEDKAPARAKATLAPASAGGKKATVAKTKTDTPKEKGAKKTTKKEDLSGGKNLSGILLRPRITEKATFASEKGVYVFEVSGRATKKTIIEAIEKFYKVTPSKVNVVKIPAKLRISKWRKSRGVKPGGKKAYVHLKKGDSIEII